jgi:hypothetical protein
MGADDSEWVLGENTPPEVLDGVCIELDETNSVVDRTVRPSRHPAANGPRPNGKAAAEETRPDPGESANGSSIVAGPELRAWLSRMDDL